jgi:hypothetical protein
MSTAPRAGELQMDLGLTPALTRPHVGLTPPGYCNAARSAGWENARLPKVLGLSPGAYATRLLQCRPLRGLGKCTAARGFWALTWGLRRQAIAMPPAPRARKNAGLAQVRADEECGVPRIPGIQDECPVESGAGFAHSMTVEMAGSDTGDGFARIAGVPCRRFSTPAPTRCRD